MENYEKLYKEALERARKLYDDERTRVGMTPIGLESIFPELQESEDERIRKKLIENFKFFVVIILIQLNGAKMMICSLKI